MKLRYGSAVVSFCPDLTSANVQSEPLAVLLVGQTDDGPVAALTWLHTASKLAEDDPLAVAILEDVPKLLRDHIDEAWEGIGTSDDSVETVLLSLRHALRNSLHVSDVAYPLSVELSDADDEFVKGLFAILGDTLRKFLPGGAERSRPPVSRPGNAPPSKSTRRRNREFLMWEPTEARASA